MRTRHIQIVHRRAENHDWKPLTVNDRTIHEVAIGADETEANTDCHEILIEAIKDTRMPPGSELKILPLPAEKASRHVPPIWLSTVLEHRYGPQVIECHDDLGRTYIGTRINEGALPREPAVEKTNGTDGKKAEAQERGPRYLIVETEPGTITSFTTGNTTQAWLRKRMLDTPSDKVYIVDEIKTDVPDALPVVTRFTGHLDVSGLLPPDDETPRQHERDRAAKRWSA